MKRSLKKNCFLRMLAFVMLLNFSVLPNTRAMDMFFFPFFSWWDRIQIAGYGISKAMRPGYDRKRKNRDIVDACPTSIDCSDRRSKLNDKNKTPMGFFVPETESLGD